MANPEWVLIKQFYNTAEVEVLRGLLEAQGIQVLLSQEGAAKALGVTVGAMGDTQLLVPADQEAAAREVLREFEAGEFE